MRWIVLHPGMKQSFSSRNSGGLVTLNHLKSHFQCQHLCGFLRQRWCLKMLLTQLLDNILFTIMRSLPRTALTFCFMSSVSAATPVDKPIHCSHLSIKSSPALTEWTCTECLFQHCSVITCTYFHCQARPWILMETCCISLPWRPVERHVRSY